MSVHRVQCRDCIAIILITLAVLSTGCSAIDGIAADDPPADEYSTTRTEAFIQDRVNEYREDHGEHRLQWDSRLARQARAHAQDMAANDYVAHTPEQYYYCGADENIFHTWFGRDVEQPDGSSEFMGSESDVANSTVSEWHHSRGHRENMLRPQSSVSGVGVAISDDEKVYIVMAYC